MSTESIQLQRALNFLSFVDDGEYVLLADSLSENFQHILLPEKMGGLGMASRNKEQFLSLMKGLEGSFERFNFQIPTDIIQSKDVVVLHTHSDGKTVSGKGYNNEYIFIIRFEGHKIVGVKEFLDSKYVVEVMESEAAFAQSKASQ